MTTRRRLPALASLAALAAPLVAALVPAPARAADVSIYDPRKLVTPPIGRIPAVKSERVVLANGVVVYLLEDHALPVVRSVAYFPASPSLVPANRVGLTSLTGEVMRSGGTAAHPGDWLDDRLAAIGATMDAGISRVLANAGFRCLTENTSEVVGLWAEMIRKPAFPEAKIELAKVGLRREIAARNDEMIPLLIRVSNQSVYGKDSPWAAQAEYATVEPIAKTDCQRLHDRVFVPERMVVAVYGDFHSDEMKKLLAAKLADWPRGGSARPELPPTPTSVTARLIYAPKEDVTQSGIIVAEPGSRADDADYASLEVLEQALGGGFSSRMVKRIRTLRGLAYATGADAGADFEKPGVFVAYSLTKSESTLTALDLVRQEVRGVTTAPLTAEELDVAKQAVVNGFVFHFEDPSQTLFRSAYYETIRYPVDFLDRYQKALSGVTATSVFEAAKRKVHPDREVAVLVGKEKQFEKPLESAGLPVERVDLTIQPPPSTLGAVSESPEAKSKAAGWLETAARAAGGAPAWAAIHTFTVGTDATITMQGQSVALTGEESWALPDRQAATQKLPFGEMKQGFDGASGWMSAMGQVQDNPKAAEEFQKDFERSLWRLFSNPSKVELVALEKPESLGDLTCNAAAMPGSHLRDLELLFAPDGRLAGIAYQDPGQGQVGPARVVERYSDWKPEGAIQYPRTLTITRDGKPFLAARVTSLKLNPPLADELFRKPAK